MFKVEHSGKNGVDKPIYSNDIKDISNIVINITNNEQLEKITAEWCSGATFGEFYENIPYGLRISCVLDAAERNKFNDIQFLQAVANKITELAGVNHKYIGYDGKSFLWKFNFGDIYLSNNEGKELHLSICKDTIKEEVNEKETTKFIEKSFKSLRKAIRFSNKLNKV